MDLSQSGFCFDIALSSDSDLLSPLFPCMDWCSLEKNSCCKDYRRVCCDTTFAKAQSLLKPFPAEPMDAHDVSPIVNSAKYDGPDCIQPVSDDGFCCDDGQALSRHLVSSSLHAIIKDLLLIFAASNRGLTPALVQVTVKVALTLKFVRYGGLPADAARQKHRAKE